jgi:predicted nucleotidyltransferase
MLDALLPQTRQRVLSLLFGQPERAFGTSEVIKLVGAGSGAVQRELDRLSASGLLRIALVDGKKRYSPNPDAAIFGEVRSLIEKSAGVADVLKTSLALLTSIRFATLYGSVAKGLDRTTSDLDVLIVADGLTLEEVFSALEPAERRLGRRVSPTMYTTEEFRRRRHTRQPFLTKVLAGKHVTLIGSEDAASAG